MKKSLEMLLALSCLSSVSFASEKSANIEPSPSEQPKEQQQIAPVIEILPDSTSSDKPESSNTSENTVPQSAENK